MARILIANDNADLVDVCQSVLEAEGHTVETVTNGRMAVELAETWRPDLMVVDWVMPELNGAAAIQTLRRFPSTSSIPILMMSGSEGGEAKAQNAGADAFLSKPFAAGELVSSVNGLLDSAGSRASGQR